MERRRTAPSSPPDRASLLCLSIGHHDPAVIGVNRGDAVNVQDQDLSRLALLFDLLLHLKGPLHIIAMADGHRAALVLRIGSNPVHQLAQGLLYRQRLPQLADLPLGGWRP